MQNFILPPLEIGNSLSKALKTSGLGPIIFFRKTHSMKLFPANANYATACTTITQLLLYPSQMPAVMWERTEDKENFCLLYYKVKQPQH